MRNEILQLKEYGNVLYMHITFDAEDFKDQTEYGVFKVIEFFTNEIQALLDDVDCPEGITFGRAIPTDLEAEKESYHIAEGSIAS